LLLTDGHLTWTRSYSDVAGDVPLSEFAVGPGSATAVLRCRLNVAVGGKCGLRLDDDQGVRLWIDGHPIPPASIAALDLAAGAHVLDFAVDLSARKSPLLRCELVEIVGSAAHAQWAPTR
jgi:hypothetical protein